uniref:Uncharacterized protein n=1 Tax=Anopheles albimanus TaxID=7167 RepID=A0A182FZH3_ANOAL
MGKLGNMFEVFAHMGRYRVFGPEIDLKLLEQRHVAAYLGQLLVHRVLERVNQRQARVDSQTTVALDQLQMAQFRQVDLVQINSKRERWNRALNTVNRVNVSQPKRQTARNSFIVICVPRSSSCSSSGIPLMNHSVVVSSPGVFGSGLSASRVSQTLNFFSFGNCSVTIMSTYFTKYSFTSSSSSRSFVSISARISQSVSTSWTKRLKLGSSSRYGPLPLPIDGVDGHPEAVTERGCALPLKVRRVDDGEPTAAYLRAVQPLPVVQQVEDGAQDL